MAVLGIEEYHKHDNDRAAWIFLLLAALGIVSLFALLIATFDVALGRDRGQFSGVDPKIHEWFDHLASRKGLCCSFADGTAIEDADWETVNGHYRVRIGGQWVDVDDEAVITEPNRVGRTMVWPMFWPNGNIQIRCFMPGAMT